MYNILIENVIKYTKIEHVTMFKSLEASYLL